MWILQKGPDEGTEACRKGLYVCVFASLCQYEVNIRTAAQRNLCTVCDFRKNHKAVSKKN